jgi:RNA polymerase sigma-70 factor, ECF subfamily
MSGAIGAPFLSELSDVDLMVRARHGDRAAYGQVVRLYQQRLYNCMLRLVGDSGEAMEITQEAFGRGLAKIAEYPEGAEPYGWVLRIGLNLAVGLARRGRQAKKFSVGAAAEHQAVLEGLGRIEMDYRVALVMRDVEGLNYSQMAEVLGLGMATVKSRLFRARLALRDEMKVQAN